MSTFIKSPNLGKKSRVNAKMLLFSKKYSDSLNLQIILELL